jgi:hypothetical protein
VVCGSSQEPTHPRAKEQGIGEGGGGKHVNLMFCLVDFSETPM